MGVGVVVGVEGAVKPYNDINIANNVSEDSLE